MAGKHISELAEITTADDERRILVSGADGGANTITFSNFVDSINFDEIWDKMYVRAKAVIVTCRYCASHNSISNPTCIRCGGPMGKPE